MKVSSGKQKEKSASKKSKEKKEPSGRDLFIGASAPHVLTAELVGSMAKDSVIFAISDPEPEIMPELAKAAGARIVGTGLSGFSNRIDGSSVVPAIFRRALDTEATDITEDMKLAAVYALAGFVSDEALSEDNIIPHTYRDGLCATVAEAVSTAWKNRQV
jgi:malate dehydrogenase (oxaloacetate-decarboxylating)